MSLSRKEMIDKLLWNSGGYGFGICSSANSIMWAMDQPKPGKPDLKSVVAISGPPKKYTNEELKKILAFSERKTARYDEMYRFRRGANLILINKETDFRVRWMRKKLSWTQGPMYSETLDEALAVMEKN